MKNATHYRIYRTRIATHRKTLVRSQIDTYKEAVEIRDSKDEDAISYYSIERHTNFLNY